MAGNYASQNSMFPYTGGDNHSQSNQHHGNYMNGSSHDMTYYENSGDHNRMFNNYNQQQGNFFASSNNQQQSNSNDQFWSKRAHNYNNRDQYDNQSVNKLSAGVNQMSIDSNRNDSKPKSELITSSKSSLMTSSSKLQSQNAKQQQQQQTVSSKTMSWASIASQPAKAQPKSYKSKLATVVLSTSTTKHVPPPMPPVAQISLDEIEPITNPWTKNTPSNKSSTSNKEDSGNEFEQANRNDNFNRNKLDSSNHSRDYNAQNHRQYRDDEQPHFDPQQAKRYPANSRFDDNNPSQPPNNNRVDMNNRFENRPYNNDRYQNRNNNGLNNSYNSHSSRSENLRDSMRDINPRENYQRDFNQPQSNYQTNTNYNNGNNYNRNDYQSQQNNRNYNYGGNNYNNYQNKYPNQRPPYNQQNNQFSNQTSKNQRPGGHYMHPQQNRNQMPPQPQFQANPIQLTEQQEIQQEKEAQALLEKLRSENNYNPPRLDLNQKNAKYFIIKSYSEDDIHRSIKYSIWCSTEHGNMKLDNAFKDQMNIGPIYLLYSVNGSGHFCGVARMVSPVDYNASAGVWAQGDKWKGQFKVKWIYVKDVPNGELRHIVLENNDFKPVTNSRDTQEVPPEKGRAVLDIIHAYNYNTSIFDDFFHYERKQYEELIANRQRMADSPPMSDHRSDRSSNTSSRPYHYQPPQHQYNKPQRQNEPSKPYSRDTSSPVDNLNDSNNSKTSLISSNCVPSNTGTTGSGQIKKSWAEQCDNN